MGADAIRAITRAQDADDVTFGSPSDGDVLTWDTGTSKYINASPVVTNPAGSGSELQFRSSGSAFGAVTGSSVSGADVTLGGALAVTGQISNTGGATLYANGKVYGTALASNDAWLYAGQAAIRMYGGDTGAKDGMALLWSAPATGIFGASQVRVIPSALSTLTLDDGSGGAANLAVTGALSAASLTTTGGDVKFGTAGTDPMLRKGAALGGKPTVVLYDADLNNFGWISAQGLYEPTGDLRWTCGGTAVFQCVNGAGDAYRPIGVSATRLYSGTTLAGVLRAVSAGTVTLDDGAGGAANLAVTGSVSAASLNLGGSTVTDILSATATLDFGNTSAQTSTDLTITVTGAAVGDSVLIGLPAAPDANTGFTGWVSAADTVTIRFSNYSSGSVNPASGTYRATVVKV